MIKTEKEIAIEISSVVIEIEKSLALIHKEKEKIKANRLKINQLNNDIRNQKIIKEVEILLALDNSFFQIWRKLAIKYKLNAGTIKQIFYLKRIK